MIGDSPAAIPAGEPVQVRVLGELRVARAGARQVLPPSKKTRALLAYLLLTGRPHRREHLSRLLWDVADDPRGALRWSLSRLRPLLDSPSAQRVIATRESVRIELHGAEVDALALRRAFAGEGALESMDTVTLERWESSFAGELLEGLELPEFDEFQAFCLAQREELRRLRVHILSALSRRHAAAPERALTFARTWARVDPLSLSARTALLRLTHTTGRDEEASQQYAAARRLFAELRAHDLGALERAWEQIRHAPRTPRHEADKGELGPGAQRLSHTLLTRPLPAEEVLGRGAELTWLRAALAGVASARKPKALLIGGEPGIGKSHLLEFFAAWACAQDVRVMIGRAHEGELSRPYGALLEGLHHAREAGAADRESFLPEPGPGAPPAGENGKSALFAAVKRLIEKRARERRALLLILEDVQWLDAASAELLHFIARTAQDAPVLVVLSLRSEEAADNHALARLRRGLRRDHALEERMLEPLSAASIEALVAGLNSTIDPQRVAAQAGGNPLFALELARVGELPDERLPDSVNDAVRERLGRLSPEAADIVRWGAVLDGSFDLADLAAVTSVAEEALVSALELLERGALLRADADEGAGRYRFAHELVRRVVYAELSAPRRQLMHGRVARALYARADHSEQSVAQLVRHAALAQDHALAAKACVASGVRCLRLFAHEQAIALARQGRAHAERLRGLERIRRMIELIEVELWCSPRSQTTPLTEHIRALGDEALTSGAASHARRAHNVLSYWHFNDGSQAATQHHMLMAELVSRSAEPPEQVLSLAEAGRCLLLLGREHERARTLLNDASRRAAQLRLEPAVLRDGQGMLHLVAGELSEAARCFEQAATLASVERNRLIEYHALEHRTAVELERDDYAAAQRLCGPLLDVASTLRPGGELPFARALSAACRYAMAETAQAELAECLALLRSLDAHRPLMHALALAARLDLRHQRTQRALERARDALKLGRMLEHRSVTYWSLAVIAHLERLLGREQAHAQTLLELAEHGAEDVAAGVRQRTSMLASSRDEPALTPLRQTQPRL